MFSDLFYREDFIGHLIRINFIWIIYAVIAIIIIHLCFKQSRSRYNNIWIINFALLPIALVSYFFALINFPLFKIEKLPTKLNPLITIENQTDYIMIVIISTILLSLTIYTIRMLNFIIQSYRLSQSFHEEKSLDPLIKSENSLRIKIIDEDLTPFVYGVFRPVIVLSKQLVETVSDKELEFILLHERQHIKHHDYLKNAIQKLIKALFYYNPLILLLDRYLDDLRESACDEEVIKLEGDRKTYAHTLYLINEMVQQKVGGLAAVPFIRKTSQLKRRILRMRNLQKNDSKVTKIIITATIVCSSLLLACSDTSSLENRAQEIQLSDAKKRKT